MEAPFDSSKSKTNLMNFSGSAADMMQAMLAGGIVAPVASEAALKVAAAPPSVPKASCDDPDCAVDHSHAGHDHAHEHGHGNGHGHGSNDSHGHALKEKEHGHKGHGHTHEHMDHPGKFSDRETAHTGRSTESYAERGFTVGIGGPVGSGKTALMLQLCKSMRDNAKVPIAAVTNDIFTREDGEFLTRNEALEPSRIRAVETGGCPHAAIREDVSANLAACEALTALHGAKIVFVESGGDNLAANFSRELADYTIYVIDVAGGDKVPRKGGPGITQSDLLIINKTDLAEAVGADLKVMDRDATKMRGTGPTLFCQVKHGVGVPEIVAIITAAYEAAAAKAAAAASAPAPSPKKKPRKR